MSLAFGAIVWRPLRMERLLDFLLPALDQREAHCGALESVAPYIHFSLFLLRSSLVLCNATGSFLFTFFFRTRLDFCEVPFPDCGTTCQRPSEVTPFFIISFLFEFLIVVPPRLYVGTPPFGAQ